MGKGGGELSAGSLEGREVGVEGFGVGQVRTLSSLTSVFLISPPPPILPLAVQHALFPPNDFGSEIHSSCEDA